MSTFTSTPRFTAAVRAFVSSFPDDPSEKCNTLNGCDVGHYEYHQAVHQTLHDHL